MTTVGVNNFHSNEVAQGLTQNIFLTPHFELFNWGPPERGGCTRYRPPPLHLNSIYTKLKPGDDKKSPPPCLIQGLPPYYNTTVRPRPLASRLQLRRHIV